MKTLSRSELMQILFFLKKKNSLEKEKGIFVYSRMIETLELENKNQGERIRGPSRS